MRGDVEILELVADFIRRRTVRRRSLSENAARLAEHAVPRIRCVLQRHGLEQLFLFHVEQEGFVEAMPVALIEGLEADRPAAVARLLSHERIMQEASFVLSGHNVHHVIFKGLQIARAAYEDPSHRPAVDVDVLVQFEERQAAVAALAAAGFRGEPQPATISHEMSLQKDGVTIDLHWRLFRPGRSRTELGDWIVASRRQKADMWVTSDEASLVIMLLHNALTEHVTGRLIRAVDLDRWLHRRVLDWPVLLAAIEATGLRTAAWATAAWAQRWMGTRLPAWVLARFGPGRMRQAYLTAWLERDPFATYLAHPLLVRSAFSLTLQDTGADLVRALWARMGAGERRQRDCAMLRRVISAQAD